jgi:hypothetical protein
MPTAARKVFTAAALIAALHVGAADLFAFHLQIEGDRLTVHAVAVPLQEVLQRLTGYGIGIRIDPDINPQVTAAFENRDLEEGLKAILRPQNHVFFWKRTYRRGGDSAVSAYQLYEIHIFRPGLKSRMINLDPKAAGEKQAAPKVLSLPDTPVSIKGNRVFVPVTIGYQDKTVETTLIFDTGAGSIVLHDTIAERLGIEETTASRGVGVGGIEIESQTTRLSFVQVGPHRKENLRADIIAYQGEPDDGYNGLLGMNFIRGLNYTIDFRDEVIRWSP